ncbi:MAG: CBS domain-containing protein [Firmicutes bacterium]|nr:CBS domain-containing protein [Bacillota bacterium]
MANDPDFEKHGIDLRQLMMHPFFVPVSKKTDELLEEMQKNKTHMAVVIDEYGGTAGIVTLEDLLEEIVGNIFDEYDTVEEEPIRADENGIYIIRGTTPLDEVEEILGIPLVNEDYETLSGLLIGTLGYIPEDDERPGIKIGDYLFTVQNIEEKRIELVKVEESKSFDNNPEEKTEE